MCAGRAAIAAVASSSCAAAARNVRSTSLGDAPERGRIGGAESDALGDEADGNHRQREDEAAEGDAEKWPRGQTGADGTCSGYSPVCRSFTSRG